MGSAGGEHWTGAAGRQVPLPAAGPLTRLVLRLESERDRFLLWAPVLVGAGIGLYFSLPSEPPLALALAPLIAAVGLSAVLRRGTVEVAVAGAFLCLGLGFAAAKLRTEAVRAPVIAAETGVVAIDAFLERIEPRTPKGERLTLYVTAIEGLPADATPARVRLRSQLEPTGLAVGAAVRLRAVLLPPPGPERPGGYDFARALWFEGIGASGFLIEPPRALHPAPAMPLQLEASTAIERLRRSVGERIRQALGGERGALAEAMITGERGGIGEERMDALRDSGLAHILAISGFNMAIMAGALFGFVRALLACVPSLALRYPIKTWAAFAGVAGAGFCLVISGAAAATTRAFVMIAVMLAATALDRPAVSMRNLAIAALVILLATPENLLDVGFQMSFAAVVALMSVAEAHVEGRDLLSRLGLGFGPLAQVPRYVAATLASTAIASLAVAPLAAFHFHRLAQYGLLGNVVAVPLFAFAVMPLVVVTLLAMPLGLEAGPLAPMSEALELMMRIAAHVAGLQGAVARVPAFPVSALALMMTGGLWLCLWRGGWRMLGLVAIAAGLALEAGARQPDVLVASDGTPVALRLADGGLAATGTRGAGFALEGWLEADADPRPAEEAAKAGGLACDAEGCIGTVRGRTVAVPRTPAALADDCRTAGIVIVAFAERPPCVGPLLVIDRRALAERGAHALFLGGGSLGVETAAAARGARPWSLGGSPGEDLPADPPPLLIAGPMDGLGVDWTVRPGGPR